MTNLDDLTWEETKKFFIKLIDDINENHQMNPIPPITRTEARQRIYFLHKLDTFWDEIFVPLANDGTVARIINCLV